MIEGANAIWKNRHAAMDDYNEKQYNEMYRSTNFIINCMSEIINLEEKRKILDVGCSGGANLYHIANHYKNCEFIGMDINEYYLREAKKRHQNLGVQNTSFEVRDFLDVATSKKYDLVASTQVLPFIDFQDGHRFFNKCIQCSNKGFFFFALFTKNPLEYQITIRDYITNEAVPYNIFSIKFFEKNAEDHGFRLKLRRKFQIDIDLPDIHKGRGTYTVKRSSGERMMFTDVLYLPWEFLYFERNHIHNSFKTKN